MLGIYQSINHFDRGRHATNRNQGLRWAWCRLEIWSGTTFVTGKKQQNFHGQDTKQSYLLQDNCTVEVDNLHVVRVVWCGSLRCQLYQLEKRAPNWDNDGSQSIPVVPCKITRWTLRTRDPSTRFLCLLRLPVESNMQHEKMKRYQRITGDPGSLLRFEPCLMLRESEPPSTPGFQIRPWDSCCQLVYF